MSELKEKKYTELNIDEKLILMKLLQQEVIRLSDLITKIQKMEKT